MSNIIQTANYTEKNRVTSFAKDVYLLALTGIFSQTHTEFKWDIDDEITKLVIADRFQKPLEDQVVKPMIYLHRGRMAYANIAIDKLMSGNIDRTTETHSDLIQGTMILNCVSSEGLEAEELGSILFTVLQAYKTEFLKLGFQQFAVNEILEERPVDIKYDCKLIEVPVITSFAFQHSWCIEEIGLEVLKNICIQRAELISDGCTTKKECKVFGPQDDKPQSVYRRTGCGPSVP